MSCQESYSISPDQCSKLVDRLNNYGKAKGFEVHSFKVGWYNDAVGPRFLLPHPPDTVAFIVISQPSMFERAFLPFMRDMWTASFNELKLSKDEIHLNDNNDMINDHTIQEDSSVLTDDTYLRNKQIFDISLRRLKHDPLDQCLKFHFNKFIQLIPDYEVDAMHDFDILPSKRPKVLVQTAGHVSGAVAMYRREDIAKFKPNLTANITIDDTNKNPSVSSLASPINSIDTHLSSETEVYKEKEHSRCPPNTPDPWPQSKKIFPVCLHPEFGGWFALRGVFVLKHVSCKLQQLPPKYVPELNIFIVNSQYIKLLFFFY